MPPPTPEDRAYMLAHINEDRRSYAIGMHTGFLILGVISVVLRFVSRTKIGAKLGKDDWLILAALVALAGHAIPCMIITRYGVGRHFILITDPQGIALANLVGATSYSLTLMFTKLSILALYHRIFSLTRGWMPTLWVIAGFVVALGVTQPFVYVFQCIPISAAWENLADARCINFGLAIILLGVIHIVTDWVLLFLPIPVVLGLQLSNRAKASICSLFLVGAVVCIISIIRLQRAHEVGGSTDPTWHYVPIQALTTVEGAIGILAACMPTWRPLFRFLGQGVSSYFSTGSRHGRGTSSSGYHRSGGGGSSSHTHHHGAAAPTSKLAHSSISSSSNPSASSTSKTTAATTHPTSTHLLDPDSAHTGAAAAKRVSWMGAARQKRSESNTSGDSVERMLQGRLRAPSSTTDDDDDVELGELSPAASDATAYDGGAARRRTSSVELADEGFSMGTARRVEVVSGNWGGVAGGGGGTGGVRRPEGVVVRR